MNNEIIFVNRFGATSIRCHAEIVDKPPKKNSKWSNGYAEIGEYNYNGKTYRIYKDRDAIGAFSYYAVEEIHPFAEMLHTWQGYEIRWLDAKTGHYLYLKNVRNNVAEGVWDYTHAKHYSEKTARKHVANIRNGIYTI